MKIEKDTLARAITSVIVAVLALLKIFGIEIFENVTEETIYSFVLAIVVIVVWVIGFWKNNDFTKEAKIGSQIMKDLKENKGDEILQSLYFVAKGLMAMNDAKDEELDNQFTGNEETTAVKEEE